jgi:hypothetical protein
MLALAFFQLLSAELAPVLALPVRSKEIIIIIHLPLNITVPTTDSLMTGEHGDHPP